MRKRRSSVLALFPALVLFAVQVAFCLEPQDKKALDLMDFAVKQTVKETGVQVIGVGSWTSEKKYKGPLTGGTSDHDMRVVLTGEDEQYRPDQEMEGLPGEAQGEHYRQRPGKALER